MLFVSFDAGDVQGAEFLDDLPSPFVRDDAGAERRHLASRDIDDAVARPRPAGGQVRVRMQFALGAGAALPAALLLRGDQRTTDHPVQRRQLRKERFPGRRALRSFRLLHL
jgi:hypothetical protein